LTLPRADRTAGRLATIALKRRRELRPGAVCLGPLVTLMTRLTERADYWSTSQTPAEQASSWAALVRSSVLQHSGSWLPRIGSRVPEYDSRER
jgi:hypothetical protein